VFTQQSERSPTLGRRDAQTAACARDQRSQYRDQICQALAFVETGGGIGQTPSLISDPLISDLWKSRKEVIQPQVPLRLPCYDFTPVADLTVVGSLPSLATGVAAPPSGKANSHGVTGGVYKARERIHRGMLIRDY
jgi:hypothetical protein